MTLTIAIAQQKGGAGKTTLTINLAAAAVLERDLPGQHFPGTWMKNVVPRTLILDMDRQGSVSDWRRTVPQHSPLVALDVKAHAKPLDAPRFKALTEGYDYVFVDCPGRADEHADSAAAFVDLVVIPIQAGPLDFFAADRTMRGIEHANDYRTLDRRPPVVVGFVLNRGDSTRLTVEAEKALRLDKRGKFLGTVRQRVAFRESLNCGESVFTFNSTAKLASIEIAQLWRALKKEANGSVQNTATGRRRGASKGR